MVESSSSASVGGSTVEVRRSARRRRSVSAYREGDKIIVLVPARLSKAQEGQVVADMVERVRRHSERAVRGGAKASDTALLTRARELSAAHLHGAAQPVSVRWVGNMSRRWGSCTTVDASIRISDRIKPFPAWVLDYVLVHELAHLLQPGHGPQFWSLVSAYPYTERARGFLDGVAIAAQLSLGPSAGPDSSGGCWAEGSSAEFSDASNNSSNPSI